MVSAGGRALRRSFSVPHCPGFKSSKFLFPLQGRKKQKGEESSSAEQSPGAVCTMLISGKVREESSQQEGIFN